MILAAAEFASEARRTTVPQRRNQGTSHTSFGISYTYSEAITDFAVTPSTTFGNTFGNIFGVWLSQNDSPPDPAAVLGRSVERF